MRERRLDRLRRRLLARSFPRLQMAAILALAGAIGLLSSAALLALGLTSMALRYPLAALLGYGGFLLGICAWAAWQRRRRRRSIDGDLPDAFPEGSANDPAVSGGGGEFGGAGGSGSWCPPDLQLAPRAPTPLQLGASPASPEPVPTASASLDGIPDLDEAWPLAIAAAALLGGLFALGFVLYASPLLLAEVLLDVTIVGALYRRSRRHPPAHWLAGVLRRTWLPALLLCASLALLGFTLQASTPDASSIGAVLRSE